MNKKLLAVCAAVLCIYLDTIFFARINLFDIRPDAMLAAAISFGVLTGPLPGALLGGIGGLAMDIIASPALGMQAAPYLLCGLAGGFFYKKFYADNPIVPAATAAACGFVKELLMALIRLIGGGRFSIGGMLIKYILPCALMSALLCMLFHLAFKPLIARQLKKQHSEKVGWRE